MRLAASECTWGGGLKSKLEDDNGFVPGGGGPFWGCKDILGLIKYLLDFLPSSGDLFVGSTNGHPM